MKKFIVRFLVWLLPVMAVAFLVDYMVSSGLRKTDIRRYAAWNDIYSGKIDADMVVLGNSQAWCSYNTYVMDSMLGLQTYNLGIDGHTLHYQLLRYETYRRFYPKPKVILLNVCFAGTFATMSDAAYDREQFFPYINDDVLIKQVAKEKRITWIDRHVPLCRYFGYRDDVENGVAAFFGKKSFFDGGMYKGFRGNNYPWSSDGIPEEMCATVDMKSVEELERFAEDCFRENVKLVFVKYPVCYPLAFKVRNLSESDSIFEAIGKEYNIPVLEYYYSDVTYDSTNYYNYTHLNKKGAALFTTELCHDLDSIGINEELN